MDHKDNLVRYLLDTFKPVSFVHNNIFIIRITDLHKLLRSLASSRNRAFYKFNVDDSFFYWATQDKDG